MRGAHGEDRGKEKEEKVSVSHLFFASKQAGGDGSQVQLHCWSCWLGSWRVKEQRNKRNYNGAWWQICVMGKLSKPISIDIFHQGIFIQVLTHSRNNQFISALKGWRCPLHVPLQNSFSGLQPWWETKHFSWPLEELPMQILCTVGMVWRAGFECLHRSEELIWPIARTFKPVLWLCWSGISISRCQLWERHPLKKTAKGMETAFPEVWLKLGKGVTVVLTYFIDLFLEYLLDVGWSIQT